MPKGAIHHIHTTASVNVEYILNELLWKENVYFRQSDCMFTVPYNAKINTPSQELKDKLEQEGFVQVNEIRKYWSSSTNFNDYMR